MTKYPLFLFIASIFLYSSCQQNKQSSEKSDVTEELSVVVVDTVELDYQGSLQITDYQEKKQRFIAFDRSRNSEVIIVFNRNGEILNTFNNQLAGQNAFFGKFNSVGFDPHGSGFMLSSFGGVYRYDSEWNLMQKWPNPENEVARPINPTGKHFILKDQELNSSYFLTILNTSHTNEIKQDKAYFEKVRNFTLVDLEDSTYSVKLGIDGSSLYRRENRQYSSYLARYAYNESNERLFVTYTNDPTVYQYSFANGDFKLENRTNLILDYYDVQSDYKYGEQINIYEFGLDSRIDGINTFDNFSFINYTKAMNHKKFKTEGGQYLADEVYSDFVNSNYKQCLAVFREDQKVYKDAVLPDYLGLPQLAMNQHTLIYSLAKFKYEFKNEIFFIIDLNLSGT